MGINRQQGGHAPGAEADLQQFDDAPAGLLFGRILPLGPKAHQQVFGAQGLFQAWRRRRRLDGQAELLPGRPGECGRLLRAVVMEPQGLRGELMLREHALDPPVIHGIVVAVADDPRQFPRGEGVGEGQPDDVLLKMSGQEGFHRGPPPGVTQGAPIEQA